MKAQHSGGLPAASLTLLAAAVSGIETAVAQLRPADRYVSGHRAALRTAAAVLAARARPARQPGAPRDVWAVLGHVAPELREWAVFFAAGAGRRIAAEAGSAVVTAREADDLVRDAHNFLDVAVALLSSHLAREPAPGPPDRPV